MSAPAPPAPPRIPAGAIERLADPRASDADRAAAAAEIGHAARRDDRAALAALADCVAADADPALAAALAAAAHAGEHVATPPGDFDPETARALLDLFRQEAIENIDAAQEALAEMERRGADADLLGEVFRKVHTLKGSAATVGLRAIGDAAHLCEERLAAWRDRGVAVPPAALGRGLEILRMLVRTVELPDAAPGLRARLRAVLESAGTTRSTPTTPPPSAGPPERRAGDRRGAEKSLLRVPAESLDEVMDLVGETVVIRTRLERRVEEIRGLARDLGQSRGTLRATAGTAAGADDVRTRLYEIDAELGEVGRALDRTATALVEDGESLRRASAGLQERLQRLRMLSLRMLFSRVVQPVHDTARELGKDVEIEVFGEDVELDRALIGPVGEVLVHLVRNAVVHGIEPPDRRLARGKPARGRVRLGARQGGDFVYVEVGDDGAGIDPARIRDALVRDGRLGEEEARARPDPEILAHIFDPGFSTQVEADALAGRGVGLDAVRVAIAAAGGEVWVESAVDRGTTFVIRLPLTTAIVQALLFKMGGQVYAVPAAQVVETDIVDVAAADAADRGEPVRVRERSLPLLRLRPLLGGERPPGGLERGPIIVLRHGEREFAITCHKIVGTRDIVMRSLGPLLGRLPLYAGATVSGAGKVQLVLDVATLADLAHGVARPRAAPPAAARGRVLLVDDSRVVREAVSALLGQAGYAVETVGDGFEAWERLQEHPFDLLVTDLEMPRMTGYDLIGRCRGATALRALPILVLTSRTSDANRTRALAAGASAFIGKPLNRRTLLQEVAEALERA